MKLGIMQPYFMPYIGYWQLLAAVDMYVIYDDVNYIKKGWINRNNILVNGGKKMFTISLCGASQNKLINEINMSEDFVKLRKTISMAYCKAPYYSETMFLLNEIFSCPYENLARFIEFSIRKVASYLGIKTEILISSDIKKNDFLKGQDKIINICELLHANHYYNAIGGVDLYNKERFCDKGITLRFLQSENIQYKQFHESFIPNLSIIDVLMFNDVKKVQQMLNLYTLV